MSLETSTGLSAKTSAGADFAPLLRQGGFRWLYVLDAVGVFTLMVMITLLRFGETWPNYTQAEYLIGFGFASAIFMAVYYLGGLYDPEHRLGSRNWLPRGSALTAVAVLLCGAVSLGADKFLMPRINLAILSVVATLLVVFNRWLAHSMRTARYGRPRVLLIGAPDDIELAESHLAESDRDAIVAGKISTTNGLLEAVRETGATDVLLLSGGELNSIYPDPLEELEARYVGVYHRLLPVDTLLGVPRTRQIAGMPFVALRAHALPLSKVHFKRTLDLIYLLLLSPILVPVALIIGLYVRIMGGKNIFYRQQRLGRWGAPFTMVKFRTMFEGAEDETGPIQASKNDPRVVPALAWLRAMRLDEIPQFINVAKGHMSIVGPRPERPELAQRYEAIIPGYGRRHDIAPGVTGLAQVRGSYHTDPGYKLGHDLQYLVNWTPILDLQIMARTVIVILFRQV